MRIITLHCNIFVLIGWTAPTRFEWWDGSTYQQERLWMDYDKWGYSDGDKMTEGTPARWPVSKGGQTYAPVIRATRMMLEYILKKRLII